MKYIFDSAAMSAQDVPVIEYKFSDDFAVTEAVKKDFKKCGYIIIRNLLSEEETKLLRNTAENDPSITKSKYSRSDGEGARATTVLWGELDDSVLGYIARSEKVAGTMESLLGGEVYPYHMKLSLKEAHTGGAWVWHQDYGYWYEDGCLFPDMATCYIAIDRATKENGCLKILVGSHLVGRIDHVPQGDQVGADLKRLALLEKELPLLHVELEAGDGIFFHCNILHRSDQNRSPNRRYGYIVSFNRDYNSPVYKDQTPNNTYQKIQKVPNSAIIKANHNLNAGNFFLNTMPLDAFKKIQQKQKDVSATA